MKKLLFVIILFCSSLSGICQVVDSVATPIDTIPKVATPAPVPTPAPIEEPAQKEKTGRPLNEKRSFGFGTGFWITPGTTYIELAPTLAYRFPKTLITGLGFRYV